MAPSVDAVVKSDKSHNEIATSSRPMRLADELICMDTGTVFEPQAVPVDRWTYAIDFEATHELIKSI